MQSVAISVITEASSAADPADQPGLAHFTHDLWFRSRPTPGPTVMEQLWALGVVFEAHTRHDYGAVGYRLPPESLPAVLALEAGRWSGAFGDVDPASLEVAREMMRAELRWGRVASTSRLDALLPAADSHPQDGVELAALDAFTADDARRFAAAHHAPSHTSLVVSGPLAMEELLRMLGDAVVWGQTPAPIPEQPTDVPQPPAPAGGGRIRAYHHGPDAAVVVVGWPLPPGFSADDFVFSALLGRIQSEMMLETSGGPGEPELRAVSCGYAPHRSVSWAECKLALGSGENPQTVLRDALNPLASMWFLTDEDSQVVRQEAFDRQKDLQLLEWQHASVAVRDPLPVTPQLALYWHFAGCHDVTCAPYQALRTVESDAALRMAAGYFTRSRVVAYATEPVLESVDWLPASFLVGNGPVTFHAARQVDRPGAPVPGLSLSTPKPASAAFDRELPNGMRWLAYPDAAAQTFSVRLLFPRDDPGPRAATVGDLAFDNLPVGFRDGADAAMLFLVTVTDTALEVWVQGQWDQAEQALDIAYGELVDAAVVGARGRLSARSLERELDRVPWDDRTRILDGLLAYIAPGGPRSRPDADDLAALRALRQRDARAWLDRTAHPEGAVLVTVGASQAQLEELWSAATTGIGAWDPGERPARRPGLAPKPRADPQVVRVLAGHPATRVHGMCPLPAAPEQQLVRAVTQALIEDRLQAAYSSPDERVAVAPDAAVVVSLPSTSRTPTVYLLASADGPGDVAGRVAQMRAVVRSLAEGPIAAGELERALHTVGMRRRAWQPLDPVTTRHPGHLGAESPPTKTAVQGAAGHCAAGLGFVATTDDADKTSWFLEAAGIDFVVDHPTPVDRAAPVEPSEDLADASPDQFVDRARQRRATARRLGRTLGRAHPDTLRAEAEAMVAAVPAGWGVEPDDIDGLLARVDAAVSATHPARAVVARAVLQVAEPAVALSLANEQIAWTRRVWGPDHGELALALEDQAEAALRADSPRVAREALLESLAVRGRATSGHSEDLSRLGALVARANTTLATGAGTAQPTAGERGQALANAQGWVTAAEKVGRQGDDASAGPLCEAGLSEIRSQLGPRHPALPPLVLRCARLAEQRCSDDEAEALYQRTADYEAAEDAGVDIEAAVGLARAALRRGDRGRAVERLDQALARPDASGTAAAHRLLGMLALADGSLEAASEHLARAHEHAADSVQIAAALAARARLAVAAGHLPAGLELAEAAGAELLAADSDGPEAQQSWLDVAIALRGAGQADEANAVLGRVDVWAHPRLRSVVDGSLARALGASSCVPWDGRFSVAPADDGLSDTVETGQ